MVETILAVIGFSILGVFGIFIAIFIAYIAWIAFVIIASILVLPFFLIASFFD